MDGVLNLFHKGEVSSFREICQASQPDSRADRSRVGRAALEALHSRHRLKQEHGKNIRIFVHQNFCSNLYKKERRIHYESLDMTNVTDNRKFWKTVKPLFSDKAKGSSNITLIENKKK